MTPDEISKVKEGERRAAEALKNPHFWEDYYLRHPKILDRTQVICDVCGKTAIIYSLQLPTGKLENRTIHGCYKNRTVQKSTPQAIPTTYDEQIRMYVVMTRELFPDRPKIVQEHWEIRKGCHCDDCDQYFKEGKYEEDCNENTPPTHKGEIT